MNDYYIEVKYNSKDRYGQVSDIIKITTDTNEIKFKNYYDNNNVTSVIMFSASKFDEYSFHNLATEYKYKVIKLDRLNTKQINRISGIRTNQVDTRPFFTFPDVNVLSKPSENIFTSGNMHVKSSENLFMTDTKPSENTFISENKDVKPEYKHQTPFF